MKLKPCPFCGAKAQRLDFDSGENEGGSCIACTSCEASSAVEFGFKETLGEKWNNRVPGSVSLVGGDIKAIMDFVVPDADQPDQLETPVTILWFAEGHSGAGYYAFLSEYPEEGCIHLNHDKSEAADSSAT